MSQEKTLQVSALQSGTVMDHLVAGTALRTLRLLTLDSHTTILVGMNLRSGQQGLKDLVKVEGLELTRKEIDRVALLSPQATFSIIRDYQVVEKFSGKIPDVLEGILSCVNPACISRDSRVVPRYHTEVRSPLRLRCFYCERSINRDQLDFL